MLTPRSRSVQRGLSLVELMVGIAVGLFVVAGAGMVVSTQLGDNRRLLLETQLQQDLRASMDIITRELRRAGAAGARTFPAIVVDDAALTIWNPVTSQVQLSAYGPITVSAGADQIDFDYRRGPGFDTPYGFKLENETIKSLVGANNWQDLTDVNVMRVTAFNVTPVVIGNSVIPCPKPCAGGGTGCWPTLTVRDYIVDIAAAARHDANVQHSLRNQVRVRNDLVTFRDPSGEVCPP